MDFLSLYIILRIVDSNFISSISFSTFIYLIRRFFSYYITCRQRRPSVKTLSFFLLFFSFSAEFWRHCIAQFNLHINSNFTCNIQNNVLHYTVALQTSTEYEVDVYRLVRLSTYKCLLSTMTSPYVLAKTINLALYCAMYITRVDIVL